MLCITNMRADGPMVNLNIIMVQRLIREDFHFAGGEGALTKPGFQHIGKKRNRRVNRAKSTQRRIIFQGMAIKPLAKLIITNVYSISHQTYPRLPIKLKTTPMMDGVIAPTD